MYENRCQLMTFAPYALCRPQILILVFGEWSNTLSMAREQTCEYPTPYLMLFSLLFRVCVVFLMPEILLTKCQPTGISHTRTWKKKKKKKVAYATSLMPKHRLFSEWENRRDMSLPQFITHSLQIPKIDRIQLPITFYVVGRLVFWFSLAVLGTNCTKSESDFLFFY